MSKSRRSTNLPDVYKYLFLLLVSYSFATAVVGDTLDRHDTVAVDTQRSESSGPAVVSHEPDLIPLGSLVTTKLETTHTNQQASRTKKHGEGFLEDILWHRDTIHIIVLMITTVILFFTLRAVRFQSQIMAGPNLALSLEFSDKQNPRHMYLWLDNPSLSDAVALVDVKVLVAEAPAHLIDPAYHGMGRWTVASKQRVRGHKDLEKLLPNHKNWQGVPLELEITVCYKRRSRKTRRLVGKTYHIPPQRWKFYISENRFIPVVADIDNPPGFSCNG